MARFLLIVMLFACNTKSKVNDVPVHNIVVRYGSSYKVDLDKGVYTVFFMNGSSRDYNFSLTDTDKVEIAAMAKVCGLASLRDSVDFEDNCQMFPKVMTYMSYTVSGNNVKVVIDQACDEHPLINKQKPEDILRFLQLLHKKLQAKPEVKNAPQTDIRYM